MPTCLRRPRPGRQSRDRLRKSRGGSRHALSCSLTRSVPQTMKTTVTPQLHRLPLALLLCIATGVFAQVAPAPSGSTTSPLTPTTKDAKDANSVQTKPATEEESRKSAAAQDAVTLSPFEVNSNRDVGFAAT